MTVVSHTRPALSQGPPAFLRHPQWGTAMALVGRGHLGEEPGDHQADILSPLSGVGVVCVQVLGELEGHSLESIWKGAEMGEMVSPGKTQAQTPGPTFGI